MSFATDLTALKTAISSFADKITTKFNNYVLKTTIGAASGVCGLDANSLVPLANIPGIYKNYDLHNFGNGKPNVNEVLGRMISVRSFTIPVNCVGSYAFCTTAPTAAFSISILKNGVQVGTISFAAGATSGTFALATAVTYNPGDQFALRCVPATQDATFSDPVISIKADAT